MFKNVKKAVSAFLVVVMTVALLFQNTAVAQEMQGSMGTGIPEGYIPIYTIADLVGINSNPSGNYILMNDIDMTKETSPGGSWDTGHGWTPLDKFSGTFEGNGHRIIGMHIYGGLDNYYDYYYMSVHPYMSVGLFSELDGAVVQNLGIVDCDINITRYPNNGYDYDNDNGYHIMGIKIGGIAGGNSGYPYAAISKCYVSGKIQDATDFNDGDHCIGGIIGDADSGSLTDCYNLADISILNPHSLMGAGDNGSRYSDCIGGIVGKGCGKVISSYNIGKISGIPAPDEQLLGGVIGDSVAGYLDSGNVENCYYLNVAASEGNGFHGIGYDGGCKSLTDTQMGYAASFTGFDFGNTWIIDELSSYPYPQLRSCLQVRVEKLELTGLPDKAAYSQGDELDLSGTVLSIAYEDGVVTSTEVDSSMVSGIDMNKVGTQTAVVTYVNGTCTFDITVNAMEASGVTISKESCSLNRNSTLRLDAVVTPSNAADKSITWESDNEAVATVTKDGVVRGVNAGNAIITVTTSNGLTASCAVAVKIPATGIKLNATKLTLKKGKKKTLKATLKPLETTDTVEWTSSNPKVASVTQNGGVKAKKKGYATIMAKTTSGKSVYAKVTVK